jgi:NAD+ synthase (glutamine-hydrolysing)
MKITIAQINTTPNDFEGNFNKIRNGIAEALRECADVVVFPELCVPGYLVRDLVYTSGFIEKNLQYVNRIVNLTVGYNLTVIIGYIDRNNTGYGKPFRNMAAVIRNGIIIATHQKRLLPTYNVFEEGIWYETGNDNCVFEINGNKCGILICEEIWRNDKGENGNFRYADDPIQDLKELGVNYIFSINSSPYAKEKPAYRINMLQAICNSWNGPLNIVYVNQIGGNDELVMDGHSMVISRGQVAYYMQNSFNPKDANENFATVEIPPKGVSCPYIQYHHEYDHLQMTLLGLHDYITKSGFKTVVLGSSGGVDSAIVATLATLAVGKENVNCIMMPSCYSSEGSVKDAKELHKRLGCNEFMVPIEHLNLTNHINTCFGFVEKVGADMHLQPMMKQLVDYNKVADENIQARMRGQIVMHYSNAMGALALTTGNKTELATGYFTIGGDALGGFDPIGDLYKMEIFEMCRQINKLFDNLIPEEIINKPPSAELSPGQTDEASLLPYPKLDNIVKLYIEKYITDYEVYCTETVDDLKVSEKEFYRITRLVYNAEFKRRVVPPTIKLSKVAFGTGRRLPIVKK